MKNQNDGLIDSSLGFEVRLPELHGDAIEKVTAALKAEGFGVLTKIDIDQAFRDKIGAEFRKYTILGACNPQLAHAALGSKPEIGLLLPCNVTVEAAEDEIGGSIVRIMNPGIMMQTGELGSDATLAEVAQDATTKLKRVAASIA